MKKLTLIALFFSLSAFAIESEKPQMECKKISGDDGFNVPNIVRCENTKEICFVYQGYGINCHIKK